MIKSFWQRQRGWSNTAEVDWEAIAAARRSFPPAKGRWVLKAASGNAPTNTNMLLWGYREEGHCAMCQFPHEDISHLLTCQAPIMCNTWKKARQKIRSLLEDIDTEPRVRSAILDNLDHWRGGGTQCLHTNLQAATQQHSLGWESAAFGFWSKEWALVQQRYYERKQSRKTGRAWMTKVIKSVWEGCWTLWNCRNKHLHSKNTLNNYHSMEDIDDQIRAELLREVPPNIPPQYAGYFADREVENVLALSNFHRRAWVAMVSRARKACTDRPVSNQTLITEYISPPQAVTTSVAPPSLRAQTRPAHPNTTHSSTSYLSQPKPPDKPPDRQTRITSYFHAQKTDTDIQGTYPTQQPPEEEVCTNEDKETDTTESIPQKRYIQRPFPDNWKKQRKS